MIPKSILEKVRRIEITTSRAVNDLFAGQYHSVFKGRGMEFDEVREYQMGDDVRTIDWNVTARTGKPHIKKFIEERELTVMILVDASASCQFSSTGGLKSALAAEIAAVLAFAAVRNNDKVGLMIFTDQVELFIPPRKGRSHVLRVIREVLYFKPLGQGTDLKQALDYLGKVISRRSVAFVLSDFFESSTSDIFAQEPLYKNALRIANKRHDVVAITLNDPRELQLPACGLVTLEDAEGRGMTVIDTNDPFVREAFAKRSSDRLERRDLFFRSIGIDHIDISTDKPYEQALVRFFARRKRRMFV